MESIWTASADLPQFPTLEEDLQTDVLIIGGGLTGILCAWFLQQAGVDYCLLEKDRICGGITANTTAKITVQHGLIYDELLSKEGRERALLYLRANEQALKYYKNIGQDLDCDMEEKDSYVYSRTEQSRLEQETAALKKLGYPAEFVNGLDLPFPTVGAVCLRNQAQFHPLKFAAALAKGLHIYEHSDVREMTEHLALTGQGSVTAQKVIVATHFPFINKRGSYYLKLYQERAYVLALKNAPKVDGMYLDAQKGGLSFRTWQDFLLVGGGSHRTGIWDRKRNAGEKKNVSGDISEWKEEVAALLPEAEIAAEWTAQDCMSLDGMPYIGYYSHSTPELFVGTGYNKWGMTGSMLSAMILCDFVQGRENEYASLFSPGRSILKPQLAVNAWEAMKGILKPVKGKRCPHMGCVLNWNAKEQTWECPCHGSRFDKDGRLLDNPATKGIESEN